MPADWRLSYSGTDLSFGSVDSHYVFPQSNPPSVSATSTTDQDAAIPRGDGVLFGQDYRDGLTLTFNIEVDGGDSENAARALESDLAYAWRGDSIRTTPNATAMLTAHTGRSIFGRPRKYQPNWDLLPFGVTAVTCDFVTTDDLWYDPQQSASVSLVPKQVGGLVAPLAAPLSTTATSDRSQGITIGGVAPVWPTIKIAGPITNPEIEVLGQFKLGFNLNLAYDQSLVIDTRPWARSILVGRGSVAGSLMGKYDRLSDASLAPGRYEVALRGASTTGTPVATFAWRNAYPTF